MIKFKFKKASILLLALPLMIFATATGDLDNISAAIKAGNSKALAEYFDNTVEVKIANKEGAYSKSQAEAIVKDFFAKNPPKTFKFIHDGPSGGNNAHYAIGSLGTDKGKFRTYVYLKKVGDKFVIQELSFENE
ncbi:MAG: DUF4783 domain-containing protein [Chitinophagales bacterium]|jgi:hypothetical protein|nr:DUF4783 domain-containing protein [Bacteroidota bacterium]MBK7569914.1 DUF4783 domain-containing protein [Bacteroidota bacterium]MBP8916364.1 DUF4783 domain-containing protein [Chitinophagales bacterium]MBP9221548.1 DUF4783 domain-containing protein [Chitinophagales bacterium]MBP9795231.1 DUF4783 domain-containing protein [Chitinophagales bacterium]